MRKWFACVAYICLGCVAGFGAVTPEQWNITVLLHEDFAGLAPTNLLEGWTSTYTSETTFMQATNALSYGADFPGFRFKADSETLTSPEFVQGTTNISFNAGAQASGVVYTVKGQAGTNWQELAAFPFEKTRKTCSVAVTNWRITRFSITSTEGTASASGDLYTIDDVLVLGSLEPCIVFSKPDGFTVMRGSNDTLTAVLVQETDGETYTWSWSGDLEGTDAALAIPNTLALGTYTVTAEVSGGDLAETLSAMITFTVIPADIYYDVVATASDFGSVSNSANSAREGDLVAITVWPINQYAIENVVVWYGSDPENPDGTVTIIGNTFTMPPTNVFVTATYFRPDYLIDFEKTWPNSTTYAGTDADFTNSTLPELTWALTNVVRGTLAADRYYGLAGGRFYKRSAGLCQMANKEPFAQPIRTLSFLLGEYGTTGVGTGVAVSFSEDGSDWGTPVYSNYPVAGGIIRCTVAASNVPGNSFYAKLSAIGSAHQVDVDDIAIYFGPASLGVTITGVTNNERKAAYRLLPIEASAANGSGNYTYEWEIQRMVGEEGITVPINTSGRLCDIAASNATPGNYRVTAFVTDESSSDRASRTVNFILAPLYPVQIPNFTGGLVTATATNAFEGDLVQLVATPSPNHQNGNLSASWIGGQLTLVDGWFTMPGSNVTVSASFPLDTAALPFNYWGGWLGNYPDGVVFKSLGADYANSYGDVGGHSGGWARLDNTNSEICIRFGTAATQLSYYIQSVQVNADFTFEVQASATGLEGSWTTLQTFHKADLNGWNPAQKITNALTSDIRLIRFVYPIASDMGGIAIDGISITDGDSGPTAHGLPITSALMMTSSGLNFELPEAVLPSAVMRATQVENRGWAGSNILGTSAIISNGTVTVSNDTDKAVLWLEY